jgi:hypothetical protein
VEALRRENAELRRDYDSGASCVARLQEEKAVLMDKLNASEQRRQAEQVRADEAEGKLRNLRVLLAG